VFVVTARETAGGPRRVPKSRPVLSHRSSFAKAFLAHPFLHTKSQVLVTSMISPGTSIGGSSIGPRARSVKMMPLPISRPAIAVDVEEILCREGFGRWGRIGMGGREARGTTEGLRNDVGNGRRRQ
jgi:hypothetical protein